MRKVVRWERPCIWWEWGRVGVGVWFHGTWKHYNAPAAALLNIFIQPIPFLSICFTRWAEWEDEEGDE